MTERRAWPRRGNPVRPSAADKPQRFSRGYLPHVETFANLQMITWRLADSLPKEVVTRLIEQSKGQEDTVVYRKSVEKYLDAGAGGCCLARDDVAAIVRDSLLHFDGERYRLHAWVLMPNHVHLVMESRAGFPVRQVVQGWKSFTAKQINRLLKQTGAVWQREYWDRLIRDRRHYEDAVAYIYANPVKARLVASIAEWKWSSWKKGKGKP